MTKDYVYSVVGPGVEEILPSSPNTGDSTEPIQKLIQNPIQEQIR